MPVPAILKNSQKNSLCEYVHILYNTFCKSIIFAPIITSNFKRA